MTLIDTHTHLYSEEFDQDRNELIARAIESGVERFYLPSIDSTYLCGMEAVKQSFPSHIFLMAGLHPCSVRENFRDELLKVEAFMRSNEICGFGESGLDFYWDTSFADQQKESLRQHILWALQYDKPLILHTRNATPETIAIIKEYQDKNLRGIFHCFSGTEAEAKEIIALGFYIGIGGVLTFKNSGLDKVVSTVDIRHIVLETDSPYLAPVPYRGKRNESGYLPLIAKKLAEIKALPIEEVARVTSENARIIFT